MDIITLTGIRTEAIIGVFDWERTHKRPLLIDISCQTVITEAAQNDDINAALDYARLSQYIMDFVAGTRFQLLEALAEALIKTLFQHFKTDWIRLTIHKPNVFDYVDDVTLTLERSR